jgi:kynurenine formamidase
MHFPRNFARIIDLSHEINERLPPWPGDAQSFEARPNATWERNGYFTRSFWMLEHYSTHLDAPVHFVPGGVTVDQIPVDRLCGWAAVIDVQQEGARDADYALPASRVADWERRHSKIPAGTIVLLRTGYAAHWSDARRYRGIDAEGLMHFPGFSAEAVSLLLSRGILGIGADAMSVDPGASKNYEVHHLALGAGIWQLENLADLRALPEAGAFLIVAPIKLEGGSGAPCRVFAILPGSA